MKIKANGKESQPPAPKFNIGDMISCGCGSCEEFDTIVGREFRYSAWTYDGVIEEGYDEDDITLVVPPKFKVLDTVKYGEKVFVVDTEPFWESRPKVAGWHYRLGSMDAHESLLVPFAPALPIERKFTNEHGNEILLTVNEEDGWVTIIAVSPASRIEHTWTPKEAAVLLEALSKLNPGGSDD